MTVNIMKTLSLLKMGTVGLPPGLRIEGYSTEDGLGIESVGLVDTNGTIKVLIRAPVRGKLNVLVEEGVL